MTDRLQLNLRLDGKRDLLETVKETAASEGLSVNAWVIKTLERATSNQGLIATPRADRDTRTGSAERLDTARHRTSARQNARREARQADCRQASELGGTAGKIESLSENGDESLRQELEEAKKQLENRPPTTGHLYQEIENLKERNRLLIIKNREERQKLEEELAALKYRDESQARRLQEKHALEIQVEELRSQLATERGDREELQKEFDNLNKQYLDRVFVSEGMNEKSVAASELPEAADLLNQLKANRKKSTASLADIEKILEILEGKKHENQPAI